MKPYSNALIATLLAAIATSPAMAEESRVDYKPAIHGALRARYEYSTADGKGRFQMRNARLQLSGAIAPSVSYFIQTDLCDR
ncbi:MAG: porin, partial [Duncaniella sp.]|nr:porin [Duncaniella sp.]